ncbi:hypothetical protein I302_106868 [Kwoniella bestiolae CBS 10118]|uniref:RNase III domain-containing protein n=1 Tax=Kwoniella bestiolae CBS 10118 TaxID=1296100 RepID=A0A1B9G060_9TREE|nr:hypothetical protein I302_05866 [Kwoniella bestiolae CBS 10118]OCF24406.1 hypothetical protein I302_05866 [Kwoniella bestiolae CBS 10118]
MSSPQQHRWDVDQIVAYRLPPYPPFDLPPLPRISDPALEEIIDSNVSTELRSLRLDKDLFVMDGPDQKSFEELHTVGFALIEAIATTWAHDRYRHFRQGEANLVRSHMIRKSSLSQLTVRYNLHTRINFDPNVSVWSEVDIGRIQAEVFEAYIGALYYSLLGTIHTATNNGEKSKEVEDGHEDTSLSSTEEHFIVPTTLEMDRFINYELQREKKRISISHIRPIKEELKRFPIPDSWERADELAKGSKTLLDITSVREGLVYTYVQVGSWVNTPWKVGCKVVDVDGREWTAEATRMTKKKAENMAAWRICVEMGLIAEDD